MSARYEYSLPAPHRGKLCRECNDFKWNWRDGKKVRERFCLKWWEKVNPDRWACFYFAFRPSRKDFANKRKEWRWIELMGWLRSQPEGTRQSFFGARWSNYRPYVCDNCRKDFFRKVYELNCSWLSPSRPIFCSKWCQKDFYRFVSARDTT